MRVLFIKPSTPKTYNYGPYARITFPPLGLEYIAAYIKDLAEVRIIDNRLNTVDLKVIKKIIEQFQPDYVGISCNYSSQVNIARKIANVAKTYSTCTVVGGWHPTLVPRETLNIHSIDIVVRGEGEITFRELIQNDGPKGIRGLSYKRDGKQIHNPDRELMKYKRIRLPDRSFRSMEAKETYSFFGFPVDCIETSRGCPYSCNFCCIHHVYKKKYRQRTVGEIIKELNSSEVRKANLIYFVDDNFMVDVKFVMALCDAIIQSGINKYFLTQVRVDAIVNHPEVFKKMADAGFVFLFLGLESFSNRTLKKLNKQIKFKEIKSALRILHEFGYVIQGNIILGANLDDKKEDLESTIEIAKRLDADLTTFSLLTPFPGTILMEQVLEKDLLLTRDWRYFNWTDPVIKYPSLSPNDLVYYLDKAYKETMYFSRFLKAIIRFLRAKGLTFHLSRMGPFDLLKLIHKMAKKKLSTIV